MIAHRRASHPRCVKPNRPPQNPSRRASSCSSPSASFSRPAWPRLLARLRAWRPDHSAPSTLRPLRPHPFPSSGCSEVGDDAALLPHWPDRCRASAAGRPLHRLARSRGEVDECACAVIVSTRPRHAGAHRAAPGTSRTGPRRTWRTTTGHPLPYSTSLMRAEHVDHGVAVILDARPRSHDVDTAPNHPASRVLPSTSPLVSTRPTFSVRHRLQLACDRPALAPCTMS